MEFYLNPLEEHVRRALWQALELAEKGDFEGANQLSSFCVGEPLFVSRVAFERLTADGSGISGYVLTGGDVNDLVGLAERLGACGLEHGLFEVFSDGLESSRKIGYLQGKRTRYATAVKNLVERDMSIAMGRAAYQGKFKAVKEYLSKGANPNVLFGGRPAIFYSISYGRPGMIKEFIEAGADVNVRDGKSTSYWSRYPLLHELIDLCGLKDMVKLAILHGADVALVDPYVRTALHVTVQQFAGHVLGMDEDASYAAQKRRDFLRIARLLVEAGIDVSAQDGKGRTARDYLEGVAEREEARPMRELLAR